MSEAINVVSPLGRYVEGNCWKSTTTGYQNKPLVNQKGEPYEQWYVGLAIPKGPEFSAFFSQVQARAMEDFPQGHYNNPEFAWKVVDGDSPVQISKPGRAGHIILRLSTGYAPTIYAADYTVLIDPNGSPQLGDYMRVNVGVQGNGNLQKPGVYLNLGMIMFVQPGERIIAGPSPEQVFGGAGPATAQTLPIGAPAAGSTASPAGGGGAPVTMPGTVATTPAATEQPATVQPGPSFIHPGQR